MGAAVEASSMGPDVAGAISSIGWPSDSAGVALVRIPLLAHPRAPFRMVEEFQQLER